MGPWNRGGITDLRSIGASWPRCQGVLEDLTMAANPISCGSD